MIGKPPEGRLRVAAAGDLHCRHDSRNWFRKVFERLEREADLLLLAGDLTNWGELAEAEVLAHELSGIGIPVYAVQGNHDWHAGHSNAIARILEDVGVKTLEAQSAVLRVRDLEVGIVGAKGFGGGFGKQMLAPFGEREIKDFVRATRTVADALTRLLATLRTEYRLVLLHYSPVAETVRGEPEAIYPFLGSSMLAEAIDNAGADLVVHGHAHRGSPSGATAGGIPVRNVAIPVLHKPYAVFDLDRATGLASSSASRT